MAIPNTMIYFTLYDQLKVMYGFEEGQKNVWSPMFAGITARSKIFSEQLLSANSRLPVILFVYDIIIRNKYFKITEQRRSLFSD